jgi:hypothetical protein
MIKHLILVLAVLNLPVVAAAQSSFSGQHWTLLSDDDKRSVVFGYLAGFQRGFEIGHLTTGVRDFKELRFTQKTDFYVEQLKSFYQLFPTCKEAYFPFVVGMLALKWADLSQWR